MTVHSHQIVVALLAGATLALSPAAALAQQQDEYPATAAESSSPWMAILCAVVILLAFCAVVFKHAKRTHLD